MFVTFSHLHPNLIFAGLERAVQTPHPAKYIRLGCKQQKMTSTLSYYEMELITAVKSFTIQAPKWIVIRKKTFFAKIC